MVHHNANPKELQAIQFWHSRPWDAVEEAAHHGEPEASAVLGFRYGLLGGNSSSVLQARWIAKAAEQGSQVAKFSTINGGRLPAELGAGTTSFPHLLESDWDSSQISFPAAVEACARAFPGMSDIPATIAESRALSTASSIRNPLFVLGFSPFPNRAYATFLARLGVMVRCEPAKLAEIPAEAFSEACPIFVIGRSGVSNESLSALVEAEEFPAALVRTNATGLTVFHFGTRVIRRGHNLDFQRSPSGGIPRVFSQELFLRYLFEGVDPTDSPDGDTREHADGHPAFSFIADNYSFTWPSTEISSDVTDQAVGDSQHWPKVGLLAHMGYRVGRGGLAPMARCELLTHSYLSSELPQVISPEYMHKWGSAGTGPRLRQVAVSIAAFCRLNKQRKDRSEAAIGDWETDLAWLKREYYDGVYDGTFAWPRTTD